MERLEVRYAGTGGQGIILLGVLTAEAVTRAGKYATQGSYYGAQVRGGITSADVVLGKEWISFPYVEKSDILVAFTSESLDYYVNSAKNGSLIIIDETTMVLQDEDELRSRYKFFKVPFTRVCYERFNSGFLLNIVAFGYILRHLKRFCSKEDAIEALKSNVPPKYIDLELEAFNIGLSL